MDQNPDSAQFPAEWPSDNWADPIEERAKLRLRLQRLKLGFSLLGLALVVASLSAVGGLIMIFTHQRQPIGVLFGIPHFELVESAIITWGSFLGVCLLWSPWPDVHWMRRSGILLMMCLVDVVLWTLDHGVELGLYDGAVAHDWFRDTLGEALGWSEFALIASLAADIASHLGEPRSLELARSVRSLATTGAIVWFLYFSSRTEWIPPIWPLRARMFTAGTFMLCLAWLVVGAICLVQSTGLTLMAGRCCSKTLREMAVADRAHDVMPSRSEDGWDEMIRKSGPHNRT